MVKRKFGIKVLNMVVTLCFTEAAIGQWILALYVLLFYGKATTDGHSERWKKLLPNEHLDF